VYSTVALGKTDDRIDLASLGALRLATIEKSLFSMVTPEFLSLIGSRDFKSFVLMGIEVCFSLYQVPSSESFSPWG
jgi:hypothetical protein